MSRESAREYPALPCRQIVYRAIRRSWLDPDSRDRSRPQLLPDAFLPRPRTDEDGLSLNLTVEGARHALTSPKAIYSIHVGRIRDLGLDVVQDGPDHALVKGFPVSDRFRTEFLAGEVARRARFVEMRGTFEIP